MSGQSSNLDQQGKDACGLMDRRCKCRHLGWPLYVVQILNLPGCSGEGIIAQTSPPYLLGAACRPLVLESGLGWRV
jgi:hypothetical protein